MKQTNPSSLTKTKGKNAHQPPLPPLERGAVHYLVPQLRGYSPSLDPGLVLLSPYNFLRQLIVLDHTYLKDSGHRHSIPADIRIVKYMLQ